MPNIVVYSKSYCPFCTRAKNMLTRLGADFEEIDLDRNPERREEMINKANGKSTVPQIFIGDTHVGGCDELFALNKAGKLEGMLK
jgi:glutaredoxin 3